MPNECSLQISITVEVSIEHGPHGPIISICSCSAHVDYVDVCIENGGFVGSIANSFFRVRHSLPSFPLDEEYLILGAPINHLENKFVVMPSSDNNNSLSIPLQRQISDMVRDMLPNQLCKMLPKIVNEQVNKRMEKEGGMRDTSGLIESYE